MEICRDRDLLEGYCRATTSVIFPPETTIFISIGPQLVEMTLLL